MELVHCILWEIYSAGNEMSSGVDTVLNGAAARVKFLRVEVKREDSCCTR